MVMRGFAWEPDMRVCTTWQDIFATFLLCSSAVPTIRFSKWALGIIM